MESNVIIENEHYVLTVSAQCIPLSLLHKRSGQECLSTQSDLALFSVTQPRPYNNEIKLAYPNKRTTYQANRVRREGSRLLVGFEIIPYEAVIELRETPAYISFKLCEFIIHPGDYDEVMCFSPPPVESFRILQLAIRNRKNFGQWLNVVWDEEIAVNILATCPEAIIDAERRADYRVLTADALKEVKLKGTEAALITVEKDQLLDCIDQLEQDYNLPRGVQSRSEEYIRMSSYKAFRVTPETVDQHIRYCKQCGFKMMTIYCTAIYAGESGEYDRYCEAYPNGEESLKEMLGKITSAGIIPGFHFLHPHIGLKSYYVTPIADHRLNLTRRFTLSRGIDKETTTIFVEQNPEGTVMADKCRVLQFGGELISYEGYNTEYPFCFTGCARGHLGTYITEHPKGQIGGILDICEFGGGSCYLDQNTDLQDEVSAKLAKTYSLGFRYIYFDGSEGTNEPFGYHVANGQYRTWKLMQPTPLYTEGAAKTHFSWHFLTGGNAFDVFPPKCFKEMIRKHPAAEAPRMQQDFTRLNFGWWKFYPDLQPDHWEYGSSIATAWDCPVTVNFSLKDMDAHARRDDLLEILRRWEDVRFHQLLTEDQKRELRENDMQEHILLINENREYELLPYDPIPTSDAKLCAYLFERKGKRVVVYWHATGSGVVKLEIPDAKIYTELYEEPEEQTEGGKILVGRRRYLVSDLPAHMIRAAFFQALTEECDHECSV